MNNIIFPTNPYTGLTGGLQQPASPPSYQMGGMVGPGGRPEPTGVGLVPQGAQPTGGAPQPMQPQMLQMQLKQFVSQNPQQVQQIRQAMMESMQSGEFTQDELNTIVQLATLAAQNPEMYSYVRNFAIQQGIADETDLPQQYDQGLIFTILLAGQALQTQGGGANVSPLQGGAAASQPVPSMADGGAVPNSRKSDGSVLINAHEGEYVVPANVVRMKGKEFFDSLVNKYKETE